MVFFNDDEDDDEAALLRYINRNLTGQGFEAFKHLHDPDLLDFKKKRRGQQRGYSLGGSSRPPKSNTVAALKRTRTAIIARHGQVVVKVLSFGHGRQSVKNQADYISRNEEDALEDQDGSLIEGQAEIKELLENWRDDFSEHLHSRDSLHMQISVPKGSDREAAHYAVRGFAKDVFGDNHQYVLVRHDDTDHPHSHILVKTLGENGRKLYPRKKDLARWREVYAREAEKEGILLDASSRRARGQGRKGKKMAIVKSAERGAIPYAIAATANEVIENSQGEHEGDREQDVKTCTIN